MTTGKFLRERRAKLVLKQYEVSDKIELSRASYANIEADRQGISVETLIKLSRCMYFSLKDYFNEVYNIEVTLSEDELRLQKLYENKLKLEEEILYLERKQNNQ